MIDIHSHKVGYGTAVRHIEREVREELERIETAEAEQASAAGFDEGFYVGQAESLSKLLAWLEALRGSK